MPAWNTLTERYLSRLTKHLKHKRVALFVRLLGLGPNDSVLDLGSEDGTYLAEHYPYPQNIVLADVDEAPMKRGVVRYGLRGYIVIPSQGLLPIDSRSFAAVWCNSVIEHVTVPLNELTAVTDEEFSRRADEHQRAFAREIARVGVRYFIQTPYLHFPLEAHAWLPLVQRLEHQQQLRLARLCSKLWVKQWRPDFYLYDLKRFRQHFANATSFHVERLFGLPKSLIAVRSG